MKITELHEAFCQHQETIKNYRSTTIKSYRETLHSFWGFTFLVTEMIHVNRKWIQWPMCAQIHTLLLAACAYGVLLQSVKLFVLFWDSIMGV
jgi:hypothetical protein